MDYRGLMPDAGGVKERFTVVQAPSIASQDEALKSVLAAGFRPAFEFGLANVWSPSEHNYDHRAVHCGLYAPRIEPASHAWCARDATQTPDERHYIQFNFAQPMFAMGIATRGRGDEDQWVTVYHVMVKLAGGDWVKWRNPAAQGALEFPGNRDRNSVQLNALAAPGQAPLVNGVRLIPKAGQEWLSMRADVIVQQPPGPRQQ